MNRTQRESVQRLRQAVQTIEQLAPLEMRRFSQQRKHHLEVAYMTLSLHAGKLHLQVPALSTFYAPQQYLEHARMVLRQLTQLEAIVVAECIPGEYGAQEQAPGWRVQPEDSHEMNYEAFERIFGFTRQEIDGLIALLQHYYAGISIQNRAVEWAICKQRDMEAQVLLTAQSEASRESARPANGGHSREELGNG
jgi:hypothetical protein